MNTLVLDAMGVIYESGDDVGELLVPFLEKKGINDIKQIQELYHEASLGRLKSNEFWKAFNLGPEIEDEYLSLHGLTNGLQDFLIKATDRVSSIWCLSNDISEWSEKLRENFNIAGYFDGFVISGDVGIRKPDAGIYGRFLKESGCMAQECIFVDDREKNLDSAGILGFQTVLFDGRDSKHRNVTSFAELCEIL